MIRLTALRRLCRDSSGATIIEFAIIAPVMLLMIMGLSDLSYQAYVQSILQGVMQKAGRDITLETGNATAAAIDTRVQDAVKALASNATFATERKNVRNFGNVKPERYTDANSNGVYDPNECFDDENGNNQWDTSSGRNGVGGANDVVLYTVVATYPRIFPLATLFGGTNYESVKGSTILRSQPFGDQAAQVVPVAVCPGP